MQLTTIERTALAVIEHAGNAKSMAWKAADSGGGERALTLLDQAAAEIALLDDPMDHAFAATTSWDYGSLGAIEETLESARQGIAAAREIAEGGGKDGLFNQAFGATQMLGIARSHARDLAPVVLS